MNRKSIFSGESFAPRNIAMAGEEGAAATGGGGPSTTGSTPSATPSSTAAAPSGASAASPSPGSNSSAPTSSPSPGPTPPVSSPTPGEEGADTFNFDGIFSVDPSALLEGVPKAPPAAAAATPGTEQQKPQPGAEPGKDGQADPGPASTEPAAPSPQEQRPSLSPSDPAALARALLQNEAAAVEHLAEQFKLSQQEMEAFEADIYGNLPKMMAKVMVKTQQSFFANLARIVPAMLEHHTTSTRANDEAEGQFFAMHSGLNKAKHGAQVKQAAALYRQMNPTVPREKMMQDVGRMVLAMNGIVPAAGSPSQDPPARANGSAPGGGNPPPPSPWTPAGASPGGSATVDEGSPWDVLNRNE